MKEWGTEESGTLLAEHRLDRVGVRVKLDKGFEQGVYCVYVEYDGLSQRIGFAAARRQALEYCSWLRVHLARTDGYTLDDLEDASESGDPQRKRDVECAFLSFAVTSDDGHWHDDAVKERFRIALLRADREWDQRQAGVDEQRRDDRCARFRQRLGKLLEGESYRQMDAATKERLVAEVTELLFPTKERGL